MTSETGPLTALSRRTALAGGTAALVLSGIGITPALAATDLNRNEVYV